MIFRQQYSDDDDDDNNNNNIFIAIGIALNTRVYRLKLKFDIIYSNFKVVLN